MAWYDVKDCMINPHPTQFFKHCFHSSQLIMLRIVIDLFCISFTPYFSFVLQYTKLNQLYYAFTVCGITIFIKRHTLMRSNALLLTMILSISTNYVHS